MEEQDLRVKGGLLYKVPVFESRNNDPNPAPQIGQNNVKLPAVELSHFNGNLNEWIADCIS